MLDEEPDALDEAVGLPRSWTGEDQRRAEGGLYRRALRSCESEGVCCHELTAKVTSNLSAVRTKASPDPELRVAMRHSFSEAFAHHPRKRDLTGLRGLSSFVDPAATFRNGGRTMTLALGDVAPDFEAQTTEGPIRFHQWLGDSWGVLFSHPKDFTPICTTELGYMARIKPEFDKRGVKIIALSVDPLDRHAKWADDIRETQGEAPNYPIISDADFNVSKLYGMLPASTSGDPLVRTPADNQTVRNVFVVGPDKKVKLVLVYPMTTGRNFDEVIRVIDSLQLTAKHKVSTPVNWKQGEEVIIAGSVNNEDAKKIYPDGWKEPKPYIRIVPQPGA
jgi:alkyl hydroperoxide reductase subunit AhpC